MVLLFVRPAVHV
jgi:uncharacterized protein